MVDGAHTLQTAELHAWREASGLQSARCRDAEVRPGGTDLVTTITLLVAPDLQSGVPSAMR
jgi:hypothetical protein